MGKMKTYPGAMRLGIITTNAPFSPSVLLWF